MIIIIISPWATAAFAGYRSNSDPRTSVAAFFLFSLRPPAAAEAADTPVVHHNNIIYTTHTIWV